jgi:OFA family oxalate/formate antiporter-like MFS transporter
MKIAFSRGWLVLAASIIMMFGFYGTSGSFGIFLRPIEESLGSTRVAASGAMSTFMAFSGIVGIIAGQLTDRYGARIIIGIGAFLGGLGYLLMYQVGFLWQLHLYFGVMAGASMGTCFTPVVATVSKWFTRKRVLAVGLTTVGIAIGQMILPPVVAFFMADHGWRSAYLLLGIVLWITAVPAVILLGKKPAQNIAVSLSQQSHRTPVTSEVEMSSQLRKWSVREVTRTVAFWMFCVIGFATAAGFYVVLVHVVAYAIDTGIKPTDAALILTFTNGGLIAAQLLVWVLTTRLSSRLTIIALLALQALALFLLMGANSFTMLITLGLIYGFGFGGSNTVRLSMISEIFGTRSAGTILGLVTVAWAAGGIFGPILAGYIFDLSRSYDIAFLVGGLLLTIGAVSGFFLKAPNC